MIQTPSPDRSGGNLLPLVLLLLSYLLVLGLDWAAVLEVGLTMQWYIHVNSAFIPRRVVKHYIIQLMARFPEQLPQSAMDTTFSGIPNDVFFIGEEDLRRQRHLDLLITNWPCQGHSRVGTMHGLDDPRSNIFWKLMLIIHW